MKNKARYFAVMALCVCLGCGTLVGCGSKGSNGDTGAGATSGSVATTKESSSTSSKKGGSNQAVTAIEDSMKDSFTNIKDDGNGVITADLSGETTPASSIEITVGKDGQINEVKYDGKVDNEQSPDDNVSRVQNDFKAMYEAIQKVPEENLPYFLAHGEPVVYQGVHDYLSGESDEKYAYNYDGGDNSQVVFCDGTEIYVDYKYNPQ